MSKALLQKVITNGVCGNLNDFFLSVSNFYTEKDDDLADYDDERFANFKGIGEISFEDGQKMVMVTADTTGDLTERSGKKDQYEKAKRILKYYTRYDAGIFVFSDTSGNFRLSLVYGTPDATRTVWSNFRRFTYFVSKELTNNTFKKRVGECSFASLDFIKDAFSVEKVNELFYEEIARYFYRLIGKNNNSPELELPSEGEKKTKSDYEEFAVRLIGRTIFCWFLKHKKSEKEGTPLIPPEVLSLDAVNNNLDYYHSVLEPLFFEVMNKERIARKPLKLPKADSIPFLNGGLFERHPNDFYNGMPAYSLKLDNKWFVDFLTVLEQYNFTIDENSTVDADVSVDPEMLGRVFENLLAEMVPETGETARKETGSYYTPRTIVDYMAEQSLKQYLLTNTLLTEEKAGSLLSYEDNPQEFNQSEKEAVVKALEEITIIDPACGSGAFPMGILHRMLLVLERVDPTLELWRKQYLVALDPMVRQTVEKNIRKENWVYIRKLMIIRDSIYGVDIQPIAVEIAKLRCFLSLVVDEIVADGEPNRGIESLPNLEFKFVAANTLMGLPQITDLGMMENSELINELASIRKEYFISSGEQKELVKIKFTKVQGKLRDHYQKLLIARKTDFTGVTKEIEATGTTQTQLLAEWAPFSYERCDWFDPKWMFGIDKGFNIVVANPPYISAWTMETRDPEERGRLVKEYVRFEVLKGHWDMYVAFVLQGYRLLCEGGTLSYILPNPILREKYASYLRKFLLDNMKICSVLSFAESNVFKNVSRKTVVFVLNKTISDEYTIESYKNSSWEENKSIIEYDVAIQKHSWAKNNLCRFNLDMNDFQTELLDKIDELSSKIGNICYVNYGAQVSSKKKGGFKKGEVVGYTKHGNARKFYEGKDLHRWSIKWRGLWLDYRKDEIYGPRTEQFFESPKVALRHVSDKYHKLGGTLDRTGMYCDHGVVLISPYSTIEKTELIKDFTGYERVDANISLEYLTAHLLSSLSNFYYRYRFATESLQQATSHVYPQAVRAMPIKVISPELQRPFINIVNNILNITKDSDYLSSNSKQVEVKELETQIDKLVYQLYDLSKDEKAVVEGRLFKDNKDGITRAPEIIPTEGVELVDQKENRE